jgi:drug/metabolite transporter (DMT)-like permease
MGAVYGLLAAVLWGVADLLARFSGQAIGAWRALFYGELIGLVMLTVWLAADGGYGVIGSTSAATWVLGVAAGSVGLLAAYALTQALTIGVVSLVMPIASSYGAVSALLSIASGEAIEGLVFLGIVMTVVGVALAGAVHAERTEAMRAGIGWALVAAFGYGISFWTQGAFVIPAVGSLAAVWLFLIVGIVIMAGTALAGSGDLTFPAPAHWGVTFGSGFLAVTAYTFVAFGFATGQIAVVAVLSTLSSVVTALLGYAVLGERLAPRQLVGVAMIIVGVVVINAR